MIPKKTFFLIRLYLKLEVFNSLSSQEEYLKLNFKIEQTCFLVITKLVKGEQHNAIFCCIRTAGMHPLLASGCRIMQRTHDLSCGRHVRLIQTSPRTRNLHLSCSQQKQRSASLSTRHNRLKKSPPSSGPLRPSMRLHNLRSPSIFLNVRCEHLICWLHKYS
jgi:hypothetical protein